jgi:hypothetical protein
MLMMQEIVHGTVERVNGHGSALAGHDEWRNAPATHGRRRGSIYPAV